MLSGCIEYGKENISETWLRKYKKQCNSNKIKGTN